MSEIGQKGKLLIIDDDKEIRYSLDRVLASRGYTVLCEASGESGIQAAEADPPDVIFLDNRMEGMTGLETLQHLRAKNPRLMVILMTAFGTTQTAIEAMKFGAFDYIVKPFDIKRILTLTENAIEAKRDLVEADDEYEPLLDSDDYEEGIVGSSEAMQDVFKTIGQVATSDVTVMITGESGTGKELVARCVCNHSCRADKSFMAVNCAAIPEDLIESELFGHEKGAFTGAINQRQGKFELCDGGTLFLDEIGDMSLTTQTKILRVLQEGEIQRVGGSSTIKVDVRLVAATNKNLEKIVEERAFREDLYYRLNVVRIKLPALRERLPDVPELIDFILQKLAKANKTQVKQVSKEALEILKTYRWPGNVRELENVVHRSVVVAQGDTILVKDLPMELRGAIKAAEFTGSDFATPVDSDVTPLEEATAGSRELEMVIGGGDSNAVNAREKNVAVPLNKGNSAPEQYTVEALSSSTMSREELYDRLFQMVCSETEKGILERIEREMIQRALNETKGNQVKTASILGITRVTLRKRIDQYSLKY